MRLLLDEMISPRVAERLRAQGHDVAAVAELGTLGSSDAHQLAVAIQERRAIVTFDARDFSILAKAAAIAGTEHWGIVLVSRRRFAPRDVGALVRALGRLLTSNPQPGALRNRAVFLEAE